MVFYYTGTGNSKYAAEKLLAVTGGELISITDCVKEGTFDFTPAVGELVGFVFPVYCYTVPMTVQNFARKVKINSDRDIYTNSTRHFFFIILCNNSNNTSEDSFLS